MERLYFSQFYNIPTSNGDDWFDPRMSLDTNLCIDPFLVFKSNLPHFKDAKHKFMIFFEAAFIVASEVGTISSAYRQLTDHVLLFPEVEEVCLGFSEKGTGGAGSGGDYSVKFTNALVSLANKGSQPPEHFEEIEIFTPGIGEDRISDATANIIKRELIEYTLRVCEKFNIPTKCFVIENVEFDYESKDWDDQCFDLPENPFNKKAVILVPKAFLRTLPAISSKEFYNYLKSQPNKEARAKLNYTIEKKIDAYKKSVIAEIADQKPELVSEYINYVKNNEVKYTPYDLEKDIDNLYSFPRKIYEFIYKNPLALSSSNEEEFINFIETIIRQFKLFVEEQDGYKLLWTEVSQDSSDSIQHNFEFRREDDAQNIFKNLVKIYCQDSKIDFQKKDSLGKKSVEFSFPSNYKNRILLILKLFRNSKLKQNELKELLAYLKSQQIHHCYYVIILSKEKEFEQVEKALEETKSINFGDLSFKPVTINAMLDRSSTIRYPSSAYMLDTKEVCISYAGGGHSDELADKLCEAFKARKIKVIRDKDELKYKNSLKDFMKRIGRGNCVITVISDKYLKSRYCMDELIQVAKNGAFRERVVPLILNDADIYDPVSIARYVGYWEAKTEELDTALKSISSANTQGIQEDIYLYAEIERTISQLTNTLRDFIVPPIAVHVESNFEEVFREVETILSK
jgi:hypothetical protein